MRVDFNQGRQSTLVGMELEPVIDDDLILKGSLAEWGYRIPFTGERGEVFQYLYRGSYVLEVYPLDGRDISVEIIVRDYDFQEESVVAAINLAYQIRFNAMTHDQAS